MHVTHNSAAAAAPTIDFDTFLRVDIRVGTIVDAQPFPQVAAVVNFPPRQIGPVVSEVLTLGFPDADGKVMLVQPSRPVPNGGRMF